MAANSGRSTAVVNADIYTSTGIVYDRAIVCRGGVINNLVPYDEISSGDGVVDLGGVNLMAAPLDLRILHSITSGDETEPLASTWSREGVFACAVLRERPQATFEKVRDASGVQTVHCKMMIQSGSSGHDLTLVWCNPDETRAAVALVQKAQNGYLVLAAVERMHVEEISMAKRALRRGQCLLAASDSANDFTSQVGLAMRHLVQRCGLPLDEVVAMAAEHIADAFGLATAGRVAAGAVARFGVFTNQCALREESVA